MMVTVDQLREHYVEFQMDGNPELEAFLDQVRAGAYGPVDREVLTAFLDAIELDIMGSIEAMVRANPHLEEQAEEVRTERQAWLRQVRRRFLES